MKKPLSDAEFVWDKDEHGFWYCYPCGFEMVMREVHGGDCEITIRDFKTNIHSVTKATKPSVQKSAKEWLQQYVLQ